ncbi:MAG: hydroxymethylbilane synthase [Anaerolineae bacterium]|jgi:hydroxymethylbilane synthase|nr:hydroxymethylbilane synthase [Anaerolineae bacterium]
MTPTTLKIGTRGSALARWQTDYIADALRAAHPDLTVEVVVISTRGDRVLDTPLPLLGGKGAFTAELESALLSGEIDCAVHSLKDLPVTDPPGLTVAAIPQRADPRDVLISRDGYILDDLPYGAQIGTSSPRRAAQLRHYRRDLITLDVRGNIDTRVKKALDPSGDYDAILLAAAGLMRLGMHTVITEILPTEIMLPAPGQAALAVQALDGSPAAALLAALDHTPTRAAVTAERAFLKGLGGGCALPVAAHATIDGDLLTLRGLVISPDGSQGWRGTQTGDPAYAADLGAALAENALSDGAADLLGGQP